LFGDTRGNKRKVGKGSLGKLWLELGGIVVLIRTRRIGFPEKLTLEQRPEEGGSHPEDRASLPLSRGKVGARI
jgi:hypothetical protein